MAMTRDTVLSFSDDHIHARWIEGAVQHRIESRTIVANVSTAPVRYSGGVEGIISPWRSTILERTTIHAAESLVAIRVKQTVNIGGIILGHHWRWFGAGNASFPRGTPLYVSSQDTLNRVQVDPFHFSRQRDSASDPHTYEVKVNLWYTPEQTDCGIHTGHPFLEVHTQVFGAGRMQKFLENEQSTMYEDVYMPPGYTHDPFAVANDDGHPIYPWHRYFADTDCIWLAIELHRC